MNVNIACALRSGVASLGITLLGVAHLYGKNISGVGHAPMDVSHPGLQGWVKKADLWLLRVFL